jgi:hypothetical protein
MNAKARFGFIVREIAYSCLNMSLEITVLYVDTRGV